MQKAFAYDVRKALIRDLLISIQKTRGFEWQTAHTKGCLEDRCGLGSLGATQPYILYVVSEVIFFCLNVDGFVEHFAAASTHGYSPPKCSGDVDKKFAKLEKL